MPVMRAILLGLMTVPLVCASVVASAQTPTDDSNVHFQGMLDRHSKAAAVAPSVPAPPSAWPRLDPGSVICRSQDDLQRRAALMRGEQAGAADCQAITQPTAIKILERAGPGATEIQITSNSLMGWTDAWLPANPPPGTTASR